MPSEHALRVESVETNGPADRAGLRRGDALVRLGGAPLESVADLHRRLGADAIEKTLEVRVLREGKPLDFSVRCVERPRDASAR